MTVDDFALDEEGLRKALAREREKVLLLEGRVDRLSASLLEWDVVASQILGFHEPTKFDRSRRPHPSLLRAHFDGLRRNARRQQRRGQLTARALAVATGKLQPRNRTHPNALISQREIDQGVPRAERKARAELRQRHPHWLHDFDRQRPRNGADL